VLTGKLPGELTVLHCHDSGEERQAESQKWKEDVVVQRENVGGFTGHS
jgi:hypothetical protein